MCSSYGYLKIPLTTDSTSIQATPVPDPMMTYSRPRFTPARSTSIDQSLWPVPAGPAKRSVFQMQFYFRQLTPQQVMKGIETVVVCWIGPWVHRIKPHTTDLQIYEPCYFVKDELLQVISTQTGCGTYSDKKYHVVIIQSTTHEEVIYLGEQVEGVVPPSPGHCGPRGCSKQ